MTENELQPPIPNKQPAPMPYFTYPWFNWSLGYPRYQPWYDDRADYNTNARDYYNYIGDENMNEHWQVYAINRLLKRQIAVQDTNTVDMTKTGDWINNGTCSTEYFPNNYDDVVTLQCKVILSAYKQALDFPYLGHFEAPNAITAKEDGLFAPDYKGVLSKVDGEIKTIIKQIEQIYDSIGGINGTIEVPRKIDISKSNNLIRPINLGDVTDNTRITITWTHGSTRRTESYTVGELRGRNAHILAQNLLDNGDEAYVVEVFTHIQANTNNLWITAIHSSRMRPNATWVWETKPATDDWSKVYYEEQDPRLTNGTLTNPVIIEDVTVYDQVPIIKK